MVPFLNLKLKPGPLRDELLCGIEQVISTAEFSGGSFVTRFEEAFARFCGARHAVAVGSGTDALWLALLGLGVGPGDEVITVPSTFFATVEAIVIAGARPVFVDIDPQTYTLDPVLLRSAITPRTKAILPVHLYGQCADMDPILEVAAEHGLFVVEDACQAHGATYKGKTAGSLANAGCFSFYPSKNLGAFGEAGAVVTDDDALAARVRMLRDHGQRQKYDHQLIGWNARMDGIQAAVLELKLKHLAGNNEKRRSIAALYNRLLLEAKDLATPFVAAYGESCHHLYVIRTCDRDQLKLQLERRGIGCGIHYPVPVHLQAACAPFGYSAGNFPVAENLSLECLSLPLFPELTTEQVHEVTGAVTEILGLK